MATPPDPIDVGSRKPKRSIPWAELPVPSKVAAAAIIAAFTLLVVGSAARAVAWMWGL